MPVSTLLPLSTPPQEVASHLVQLGAAELLIHCCHEPSAPSQLLRTCVCYIMALMDNPLHVEAMGGLPTVSSARQMSIGISVSSMALMDNPLHVAAMVAP